MKRAGAAWAAALAGALPAQLYTTDAGVLSPALPSLRERLEWRRLRDTDEWLAETRLQWSPSRALQLDLALPFVARRTDGAFRGRQEGLGDALLGAKIALVRDDDVMRSDRLSVLFEVQAPTADTGSVVDGVDLGPRAGLGLDVFGVAVGVAGTIVRDRHRAALALRWLEFGVDDGFAPGSVFSADLAWWYRLAPRAFSREDATELRLTTELLTRVVADDRRVGDDPQNGGTETTLVVGLQANPSPTLRFEAGVRVPLVATTVMPFGDERIGALFSCRMFF